MEVEDEESAEVNERGQKEIPKIKALLKACKMSYQEAVLEFLSTAKLNKELTKKILLEMSKKILPNFENPLLLSDFLTHYLNQEDDIELQVLALRAIFILLEKHGLDYPNYYKKLYAMIEPKLLTNTKTQTVELQSIFNMPEKSRFLRLLDLSLRSAVLPTQLIASFLKRLSRIIVTYGEGFTP